MLCTTELFGILEHCTCGKQVSGMYLEPKNIKSKGFLNFVRPKKFKCPLVTVNQQTYHNSHVAQF